MRKYAGKVTLLAADREEVKLTLALVAHHRKLANEIEAHLHSVLARYGVDLINENWTLDADRGVLTHDQESPQ